MSPIPSYMGAFAVLSATGLYWGGADDRWSRNWREARTFHGFQCWDRCDAEVKRLREAGHACNVAYLSFVDTRA